MCEGIFKILPIFLSLCFPLLSWQSLFFLGFSFLPSSPLKQNVVNYLLISPLNNVLIVHASLAHLVTLLLEHSLGHCLSHFPLHLMSPCFFSPLHRSSSVHLHSLLHWRYPPPPTTSISLSSFFSFSVIIFLPFYLAITPTPCPSFSFLFQLSHPPPDHEAGCQCPFSFN